MLARAVRGHAHCCTSRTIPSVPTSAVGPPCLPLYAKCLHRSGPCSQPRSVASDVALPTHKQGMRQARAALLRTCETLRLTPRSPTTYVAAGTRRRATRRQQTAPCRSQTTPSLWGGRRGSCTLRRRCWAACRRLLERLKGLHVNAARAPRTTQRGAMASTAALAATAVVATSASNIAPAQRAWQWLLKQHALPLVGCRRFRHQEKRRLQVW
jgi:hypothetical protein